MLIHAHSLANIFQIGLRIDPTCPKKTSLQLMGNA
jgi:hypothetical protein